MSQERAILMSTPMVQGSLTDLKTETRRLRGLEKLNTEPSRYFRPVHIGQTQGCRLYRISQSGRYPHTIVKCPYGDVGSTLWVRETWAQTTNVNRLEGFPWRPHIPLETIDGKLWTAIIWAADGPYNWCDEDGASTEKSYWKPSIHMPRTACRLLLDLQSIRLERLQDITELGAVNEGVEQVLIPSVNYPKGQPPTYTMYRNYGPTGGTFAQARNAYISLWDKLNVTAKKKVPFSSNPWVWVLGYRRITKIEPA